MTADAGGIVKGSIEAEKSLRGVEGATKDLNTQLGAGKEALNEHGRETEEAGEAAKKAGEGFKIFGHGAHEAHAALRVLNEAIPGFETMARFLSNRLTLLMGMGGAAIAYVKEKCDDLNKALDDLNSSPGARGEWADQLKEKAEQAAVSYAVWEDHIRRVILAEQTLEQLADRTLAVDRERISSGNAISQAQKELAEARLELAVKLGQVTPEQAVKIKLEIDETAFKEQLEIKTAGIEAEIKARNIEYQNTRLLAPQHKEQADAAQAAAVAAEARENQE